MTCNRLLLFGILFVLLGIQFRLVESFVLNDKATAFINSKFPDKTDATETLAVSTFNAGDWWNQQQPAAPVPAKKVITPPRWLGWSLMSVGSVLVLTCPCFKKSE